MTEPTLKRCLLAVDVLPEPELQQLALPLAATVAEALASAGIDCPGAATGIWGVRCERGAIPADGDRIEVYRPLAADPRERRRERVRRTARG